MRKLLSAVLALSIMFTLCIPVHAETKESNQIIPSLSISGTTATCNLTVVSNNMSYPIEASVKLMKGNTTVKSWSGLSANGYLSFSDTASVSKGNTYTMKTTVKINGVSYYVADIVKTCN